MKTVTKEQFKKDIIAFFKKETGLSIAQAKAKIKSLIIIDKWGNTTNETIKAGNVKVYYVNNPNYCQGAKNGYGKGYYISNQGFTGGSIIKL